MTAVKRLLYLFIFLLILYVLIGQADSLGRFVYPFPYREFVVVEARKYDLDPLLVISIIRVESSFRQDAVSGKGARGLMQIMPQTGSWIAEQLGLVDFSEDSLFDPFVNITLGTWYLSDLFRQFDADFYPALAAYNGGRGHVKRWLEEGIWDGKGDSLEDIPFPETRSFIRKVERTYRRYQQIYKNDM